MDITNYVALIKLKNIKILIIYLYVNTKNAYLFVIFHAWYTPIINYNVIL